jgi:ribonuclease III
MSMKNLAIIDKCLVLLIKGLYPYVEDKMKAAYGNGWLTQAKNFVPSDKTLKRSVEESLQQDISSLLNLINSRWDKVFKPYLSPVERALVSEIIDIRNKWAHKTPFSLEDTYRALDSITRLLNAIQSEQEQEVSKEKQNVLKQLLEEQNRSKISQTRLSNQEIKLQKDFEELLQKIPFQNVQLLHRALTHRTFLYENPGKIQGDNEQLEFLGDCVLGLLAGDYVCQNYPDLSEGELSRIKEKLVDNQQLAYFAKQWDLGKWILLGKGEESQKGREKTTVLSDAFEALIGAYYRDSGFDAVNQLVIPLFESVVDHSMEDNNVINTHINQGDPKGFLQQQAQKQGLPIPIYKIIKESGFDHAKEFVAEVTIAGKSYGTGQGKNKKEAEKNAALNALDNFS